MATQGSGGVIDLTAQPMPSGSMRSDDLILERFTREQENLGKQAQPISELSRSLRTSVEEFRRMTVEISRMGDAMRDFGNTFRGELGKISDTMRGITGVVGGQKQSSQITPAITGAITAATVSNMSRQIQQVVVPSIATAVQRQGRAVVTGSQVAARATATQGGKSLLDILNTGTAEEIAALGLPGVGKKADSATVKKILAERANRPFATAEEVSGRIGIGGLGTAKEQALTAALQGQQNLAARKPLTPREQVENQYKDSNQALSDQIKLLEARERFAKSSTGEQAIKTQGRLQRELNQAQKDARWAELVATQGYWNAVIQSSSEKINALMVNLRGIGNIAQTVFGAATGAVASMSSVANPVEWQTFKRSIEGVAASVGTVFAPILNEASGYLQRLADWFANLDQGTKDSITSFTKWTIIVSGSAIVISRLLPLISGLGTGLLTVAGRLEGFLSTSLRMGSTLAAFTTLGVVIGGVALAGWGVYEAFQAMNRERDRGQAGNRNQQDQAQRTARTIREISDPEARRRIETGGTPEETERRINEYREQLNVRVQQAERERLRATGETAAERARLERQFQEAMPDAREQFRTAQEKIANSGDTALGQRLQREAAIDRITQEAFPAPQFNFTQRQVEETRLQRDRMREMFMTGRDAGVPLSPAATRAQQELDRLNEERSRINQAFGEGGLRQSVAGLLPSPQMFQDFAQFGEQLTMKSLERQGQQDILLSMQRIESIANALGTTMQLVADRVDVANLVRIMGGFTSGR